MKPLPFESRLRDAVETVGDVTALSRTLTIVSTVGGHAVVLATLLPLALREAPSWERWTPIAFMTLFLVPLYVHAARVAVGARLRLTSEGIEVRRATGPEEVPWAGIEQVSVRGGAVLLDWRLGSGHGCERFWIGPAAWAHYVAEVIRVRIREASRA